MPEENRVFDVAKPGHGQPQATSKPVIVGHQPAVNDPMVNDTDSSAPTKISVLDGHDDFTSPSEPTQTAPTMEHHDDIPVYKPPDTLVEATKPEPPESQSAAPAVYDNLPPATDPIDPLADGSMSPEPIQRDGTAPLDAKPIEPDAPPPAHVEALAPAHVRRNNPVKWLLALLIIGAIVIYVLLGTGIIKNSLSLPPFKKKNSPAAATSGPPAAQNQAAQSSLPTGFSKYNLSGTNLSFAAPTSWGTPSSTSDPGYSKRGGTNQSDGIHSYIVDFPNNKAVEIAVTSSKYLPASRDSLYYDYLQWCTGTADGKYYFSNLEFTTAADKTQTPSTVACDQGPLTGVTPIDSATIVQLALKNSSGQSLGDLYTKNLNDPNLPVLRVKDSAMTNSADIKQLLKTIQVSGAASSSTTGSQ